MKIFIKIQDGRSIILNALPTHKINEIKNKIYEKVGIPVENQCLIYANNVTKNWHTIQYYSNENHITFHLTILLGVTPSPTLNEQFQPLLDDNSIPENVRNAIKEIENGLKSRSNISNGIKIDVSRLRDEKQKFVATPQNTNNKKDIKIPEPSKIIPDLPSKAQFDMLCNRPTQIPKLVTKEELRSYTKTDEDAIELAKLQNFITKKYQENAKENPPEKLEMEKDPVDIIRERQQRRFKRT